MYTWPRRARMTAASAVRARGAPRAHQVHHEALLGEEREVGVVARVPRAHDVIENLLRRLDKEDAEVDEVVGGLRLA